MHPKSTTWLMVIMLVALGVFSRLAKEFCPLLPPNFHAIVGTTLFAGFLFRSRVTALLVPIASMLLSDLMLGGYEPLIMATVYGAICAPVLLGNFLRKRPAGAYVMGASLTLSLLFYLTTNLAVWYCWYPHSLAGFVRCYGSALAFFKYTLAGDLVFASGLFGVYYLATAREMACESTPAMQPV